MRSVARILTLFAFAWLIASCGHKRPYAPGNKPLPEDLLARARPQIEAVQVGEAKVVLNRTVRGDLAFIAQQPGRFRGSATFKGNELATLALHEKGYQLRYKMDAFPAGFYEGPSGQCAVRPLIGVELAPEALVALVLGGAPVIPGPHEVLEQKWSRKDGWERLVIANASNVQELRYAWLGGQWHYVGGTLWLRSGDDKGPRLWTLEHRKLQKEGSVYLPERTRVLAPSNRRRRDEAATIIYKGRNLNPPFAQEGADDGSAEGGGDDWGDDDDDDDWEDDGGWENDGGDDDAADGGWENDGGDAPPATDAPAGDDDDPGDATTEPDAEAPPSDPEPEPQDNGTTATLASPAPSEDKAPSPPEKTEPKIPAVFFLEPTGLVHQGDLCRP